MPRAEIVALEGRVRLAAQRGGGLRHLPGIGLDLGFQPDRGVGEIVALERLFGGLVWAAAGGE